MGYHEWVMIPTEKFNEIIDLAIDAVNATYNGIKCLNKRRELENIKKVAKVVKNL